jgi:hypothetical protein
LTVRASSFRIATTPLRSDDSSELHDVERSRAFHRFAATDLASQASIVNAGGVQVHVVVAVKVHVHDQVKVHDQVNVKVHV